MQLGQLQQLLHPVLVTRNLEWVTGSIHDVQRRGEFYYAIAEVRTKPHGASGEGVAEFYGITTEPTEGNGLTRTHHNGVWYTLWSHPFDPKLPGLPMATKPSTVEQYFGEGSSLKVLNTKVYRPLRRAVLLATFDSFQLYLKVLRAGATGELYHRHRILDAAGIPTAQVVTQPVDDVIVLRGLDGISLAEYVRAGTTPRDLVQQIQRVLNRFPAELMSLPRQPAWSDRIDEFLHWARLAMGHDPEIDRLGHRLAQATRFLSLGPLTPVHGDFYEAHLFLADGKISGILDIDSAGPGYRVDDYACLLAHVAVLGTVDAAYYPYHEHLVAQILKDTAGYVDHFTLGVRAAGVVLSLVPPYQPDEATRCVGEQRIAIAHRLLDAVGA